jgi:hypothetical protein
MLTMKRTEFNTLIERTDPVGAHAIGRALVHLLRRQTQDEQRDNITRHRNAVGFNGGDGRRGVITAKYYIKHNKLEQWQIKYWLQKDAKGHSRLGKYYKQIAEEANKKRVKVLTS